MKRLRNWEDHGSWQDFFDTYWKLIYAVAIKAGLSEAEARDVVQETVVAVAKQMRDGGYDRTKSSFKNWLCLITRRRIIDHFRKRTDPQLRAPPQVREDTSRTDTQQLLLDAAEAQGADSLKEQYLLRYMLNVETRGSQSLLNVQAFTDPTAYKLKVKRPGSDESREVNVDLLETFNWLIGLTVKHIAAPQIFSTAFERDIEKRLRLSSKAGGRLKQDAAGPYWFRTVTGTTPDGRKALIIWRKLTGEPEQDNLVLDEWFTKQGYSAKDSEFDLIYVNGGNNLENLKTPDDLWKVRLIEEDFHRLMFEMEVA